jgi:hypothetical protein
MVYGTKLGSELLPAPVNAPFWGHLSVSAFGLLATITNKNQTYGKQSKRTARSQKTEKLCFLFFYFG